MEHLIKDKLKKLKNSLIFPCFNKPYDFRLQSRFHQEGKKLGIHSFLEQYISYPNEKAVVC